MRKMNSQERVKGDTSSFELSEFRSSNELTKFLKIKQEKVVNNLRESKVLTSEVEAPCNMPNKPLITKKVSSKQQLSSQGVAKTFNTKHKKVLSNLGGTNVPTSKVEAISSKPNKPPATKEASSKVGEVAKNNQGKLPTTTQESSQAKGLAQFKLSYFAATNKANLDSRHREQTLKTTTAGNDNLKENRMRKRAICENNISSQVGQPKERVVEEDLARELLENESKKTKKTSLCPSMLIDEFLKGNGVSEEMEEEGYNGMEEEEEEEEENAHQEQGGDVEGTSKKRTRGPTQCLKIYARSSKDRQEVIFDDDGEPIGPDDKTVSDLSYFLGTIARSANYCPLIYTNFKLLVKNHKKSILRYLNHKFIIPEKGEKAVLSRINDAWRSYKSSIKKKHFLKYSTTKERLKHRPQTIPEEHFKKLMLFWNVSTVQTISQKNAQNRRKQKYMHRVGPINFARIRARLLAKKKEGEEVSQAEMFIETRKGQKGKAVDEQTQMIVDTLQESIENSSDDAEKTFHSLFGKEKPGRVRCYGRTMTPSILKKNVEIASIKKQYSNQITAMERKMQTYDAILKLLLKQQNPDLSEEAVNNLMQCAFETDNSEAPDNMGKSSAPHSSTSTNVLLHEKVGNEVVGEEDEDEDEDFEDFED